MAKARTFDVTTQNVLAPHQTLQAGRAVALQSASTTSSNVQGHRIVQIEVPLTEQPPPTEFVFHVDCKLTPQQSTAARRIAQQLDRQNACLNNGQRIVNVHGALKWLLEQVAEQLG